MEFVTFIRNGTRHVGKIRVVKYGESQSKSLIGLGVKYLFSEFL